MRLLVSRLLLAALVLSSIFAIVRLSAGASHPADVVHLGKLRTERLAHAAFSVGGDGARVAVHLVGSLEGTDGTQAAPPLAAYGWLVWRDRDSVVWRPRPRRRPARGSVFAVRDTLALAPGHYDVYFAAYGDPLVRAAGPASEAVGDRIRAALSRGGRAWMGESDRWRMAVAGASGADRARLEPLDHRIPRAEGSVWTSGPVQSGQTAEAVVRVEAPATVRLRATTEVTDGVVADSATVVRLDDGATVWSVDPAHGRWAGGSLKNMAYDTLLTLEPGLYRVRFAADRSHAAGDWTANPPYLPGAWGLRLDAAPEERVAVVSLDTVEGLPQIARLDCVGPDRSERLSFELSEPVVAVIAAAGELSSSSNRYDFATLEHAPAGPGRGSVVWTMDYDRTQPAGGASRNRRETAVVALAPGRYVLRYETDDSHDCEDGFPDGAPDHPLWGVIVAAASPAFDPAQVRHDRLSEADATAQPLGVRGPVLAQLARVGPFADREVPFSLDAPGTVRVVAVGELLPSQRLDWGWIEDEQGNVVWTMTRENTQPAGGAAKNRRFDGVLDLPAGAFMLHFRTNEQHDAERFDAPPPSTPDEWGIRVEQVVASDEDG